MDLLILIILTIIYCFVICFIVQSSANKCEGTISRIKIFIPNCKENIIMFWFFVNSWGNPKNEIKIFNKRQKIKLSLVFLIDRQTYVKYDCENA